jgi:hypothetical protein
VNRERVRPRQPAAETRASGTSRSGQATRTARSAGEEKETLKGGPRC